MQSVYHRGFAYRPCLLRLLVPTLMAYKYRTAPKFLLRKVTLFFLFLFCQNYYLAALHLLAINRNPVIVTDIGPSLKAAMKGDYNNDNK